MKDKGSTDKETRNLFGTKDRGPFYVFLKRSKSDENIKNKSALDVAKILFIVEIKFQEILYRGFVGRSLSSQDWKLTKLLRIVYLKTEIWRLLFQLF